MRLADRWRTPPQVLKQSLTSSEVTDIARYLDEEPIRESNRPNPLLDGIAALAHQVYMVRRILLARWGGEKLPAKTDADFRVRYEKTEEKPKPVLSELEKQDRASAAAMSVFAPLMKVARRGNGT